MRITTGLVSVLLIAACATGYHGKGFSGGFSETQLAPNAWNVRFGGNAYTSGERAADFTLLRAAELMLENGYSYFIITDSGSSVETGSYTTPTQTYGNANIVGNSVYGSSTTYGGQTYTYHKPSSAMAVVGYREKPDYPMVYEAAFVAESIRSKYGME